MISLAFRKAEFEYVGSEYCQNQAAAWILDGSDFVSTLQKVGVILILLVLIVGPLVQIYDCFNDAPVLDHDALLHTVDALLCIIFILVFAGLWTFVLAILRLVEGPPDISELWAPRRATFLYLHPFQSSPPPIRI